MEECELCGEPMSSVYTINVEGVELRVCANCAKGKKVVHREEKHKARTLKEKIERPKHHAELELVDDYGKIIRNARESMKIPIKVLAERINEKETLLARVEQQRTMPTAKLTKKLEKALNIRLEHEAEESKAGVSGRKDSATLGEFID